MKFERQPVDKGNKRELLDGLKEEISDLTEILAEEKMSEETRQKLTTRVKSLSEKRDVLIENL